METFGLNATITEAMKNTMPTRALAYLFNNTMPVDFNSLGFPLTAKGLIENCSNVLVLNSYFVNTEARSTYFTSSASLIKSGDVVAQYRGEPVTVREGANVSSSFADHVVWYPKSITCKNDYRDHNTFTCFMYKTNGEYGFDGLDTFIARTTENDEAIVFEYDTELSVNCFGIKQSTTVGQVANQFVVERWDGNTWVSIETTPANQTGYLIIRFAEVTASRFRIRKIATTGAVANIDVAFAYFGKFGFAQNELRKNVVAPKFAIIVPEHISATTLNNLITKQNDIYGNRNSDTDHLIMCSAGTPDQNVYMRVNFPSNDVNSKYNFYLVAGQLL
jgi:hypothetical protein